MKHGMPKVVSLCEARPAQVKREAKESVLRLFLFQMEIRHEWKVLAYVLNVGRRLNAAVAVSQIMWLFPNSNSVFRGQCCTRWAPGHRSVREEIGCACASPIRRAAPLVLGHPMVTGESRPTCGVVRMFHLCRRRKQKKNQTAQGRSTPPVNNRFRHVLSSPGHVPPTLLSYIVQETFPTTLDISCI